MSTLFPAPLLPMTPIISPSGISNDTLFRTRVSSKSIQRSWTLMNGFGMIPSLQIRLFFSNLAVDRCFPILCLSLAAFSALFAGSQLPPDYPSPFQRSGPVKVRHGKSSFLFLWNYYTYEHKDLRIRSYKRKSAGASAACASTGCYPCDSVPDVALPLWKLHGYPILNRVYRKRYLMLHQLWGSSRP